MIKEFILENVRCFEGLRSFRIRPLTLLVGENSTGKSTLLGCMHALSQSYRNFRTGINFNIDPFQMGSFKDIARKPPSSDKIFQIGYGDEGMGHKLIFNFSENKRGAEPVVEEISWSLDHARTVIFKKKPDNPKESGILSVEKGSNENELQVVTSERYFNMVPTNLEYWFMRFDEEKKNR